MLEDLKPLLFFIVALAVFMYVVATEARRSHRTHMLDTCAKQHDVYECELVAVPVVKGEQ